MINPSTADEIEMDRTTMNIINNLKRLNYTSVDVYSILIINRDAFEKLTSLL